MASVASDGQSFADGTVVRNLEAASLTLTGGDDVFRDDGPHDDGVNGSGGNDDLGTSGGRDFLDGADGEDTLTIDYRDATERVDVDGFTQNAFVDTGDDGSFGSSTRRVDGTRFEHIDARTGSGDDRLEGISNASDTLNGGAGVDTWEDSFSTLPGPMNVSMEQVASSGGQTFSDGTLVRNLETARLTLTDGNDVFRDFGPRPDAVFGDAGDDDLGTSDGQDFLDGVDGEDTLTIDYRDATERVDVDGFTQNAFVDTAGNGSFGDSTRRVDGTRFEHIDAITGSGDDRLEGISNASDTLNGGAGVDTWEDSFSTVSGPMNVSMEQVASSGGQTFSDGTLARNLETARLTLTDGNDVFRDFGPRPDAVFGDAGDDDLGTSDGQDFLDGVDGEDTLTIDYRDATERVDVDGFTQNAFVDTAGNGSFGDSTRRVDGTRFEHIDARTGSGDDRLEGIPNAADTLNGGAGVDTWEDSFSAVTAPVVVSMRAVSSAGGQTLSDGTVVRNIEAARLALTGGNDRFSDHGPRDDAVNGGGGDDRLATSGGRDILDGGGAGDDTLRIDYRDATERVDVDGFTQNAFVDTEGNGSFGASTRRVDGTRFEHINARTGSGDDRLEGITNASDTLDGGAGEDEWQDSFSGRDDGFAIDMARAATARGLSLPDGTRVRRVEKADLTLTGGNDSFADRGARDDTVNGSAGNDTLATSRGRDVLDGNDGIDHLVIDYGNARQDAFVDGFTQNAFVDTAGNGSFGDSQRRVDGTRFESLEATTGRGDDRLSGMNGGENRLSAGRGRDTVDGGAERDILAGGRGDDLLSGEGGRDRLDGGNGNDILSGGAGNDRLGGGNGSDLADYADTREGVTVLLARGRATGSEIGRDRLVGIEEASGGRGDDRLRGDGGDNGLSGGRGDDTVKGGGGDDGLSGGAGADLIDGERGDDAMTGGSGADVFFFGRRGGDDVITDFEPGVDKADLTALGLSGRQLLRSASQGPDGVTGDFGRNGSLTLEDLSFSDLSASDFII